MKGFVPTPQGTVDLMVARLFQDRPPRANDRVLDPGCGTGAFIDGITRWCRQHGSPLPRITGVEVDPQHVAVLQAKYAHTEAVYIKHADFLAEQRETYHFIVGNPPYVAITALSEDEKAFYRAKYATAYGRFDLYMLFFEQALRCLIPGGRLVFITPEKYHYVESAGPLRNLLAQYAIEEIRLLPEDTFGKLVTYPTLTVLSHASPGRTAVVRRDGSSTTVGLPQGVQAWQAWLQPASSHTMATTLGEVCLRVSCGVATGADRVFVHTASELEAELQPFAYPTIAGRQLRPATTTICSNSVMLMPYDVQGRLRPITELGALGCYLMRDDVQARLMARTCVKQKPWYGFHETPGLQTILRPKILCKDISATPQFWLDSSGEFVPRHSVYYMVPRHPGALDALISYLHSKTARQWLEQHCQRAAQGFLRLQSRILQQLPLPDEVAEVAMGGRSGQASWAAPGHI